MILLILCLVFIIESFNIIGAFDDCMSLEPNYYLNISNIYLLGIMFYPRCKLDYLYDCLENYYKYLVLTFNVPSLVRDVRKLFYSLYNKYAKFYGLFLNINIE